MTNISHIFPYNNERIAIFIDGSNLAAAAKSLSLRLDYQRLLTFFRQHGYLVRAYFYTATRADMDGKIAIKPLMDYLSYNNYVVVTKEAKQYEQNGVLRTKGNMDIEIAVDVMKTAQHVNHIVLFSGDGDFVSLVKAVQEKGVRFTVISTYKGESNIISDDLRKQADHYIDLDDIRKEVEG